MRQVDAQPAAVGSCGQGRALTLSTWSEPEERPSAVERVESLDVLRGLMALAVAVYHLGVWTHAFEGAARSAVIVLGIYSVEGFFIISGFCFFHLYRHAHFDRDQVWRFHVKRFWRIAPLYYLALALTLAFDPTYRQSFTWGRLVENLTLSFGLFHPNHSMVLGGWSIGLEYVFYLVLPAVLWVGRQPAGLYVLALLLFAWGLPFSSGAIEAADEARRFHLYVQMPNHAASFVFGAIIAQLRARTDFRLSPLRLAAALAVLVSIAVFTQPPLYDHFEVMVGSARLKYVALCVALVLLCALVEWPRASTWAGPFRWLGSASYSVYLIHPLAWLAIDDVLGSAAPASRVFCGLLATLVLAALAHRYIERPGIALGRRLSRVRSRSSGAPRRGSRRTAASR